MWTLIQSEHTSIVHTIKQKAHLIRVKRIHFSLFNSIEVDYSILYKNEKSCVNIKVFS